MITLISDPSHSDLASPANVSGWLATESPNNFRLLRMDWGVTAIAGAASPSISVLTVNADFTGNVNDDIALYSAHNGAMYIGKVVSIDAGLRDITTDIDYDAAMTTGYLNDNTLRSNYYFEGRLTINGVVQTLTIIASPDSFGYADLDVSGILRISTSLGKTGNYTALLAKETTKSGSFTFEYRECWYASAESYQAEGNTWYYVEAVRSEEQGSNLHDYVADATKDVPFFNSFERPVYFKGLPFDISFILPFVSGANVTVTVKRYNSSNTLLGTTATVISASGLEGFVNSLNITPDSIEDAAAYLTAEISI